MRRNELLETTALAPEATASSAAPIATTTEPETKTDSTPPAIDIPEECAEAFIAAVEIGYYKEFYRQGLITADELDILLQLQKKKAEEKKNKKSDLSVA
ncbi:MAG: hypothetical protein IK990_00975 [Ruminiclostridium sp.]|nr:hypothetical protein [Ruminiclostridium sp.]